MSESNENSFHEFWNFESHYIFWIQSKNIMQSKGQVMYSEWRNSDINIHTDIEERKKEH